jgi:hypothetical protein
VKISRSRLAGAATPIAIGSAAALVVAALTGGAHAASGPIRARLVPLPAVVTAKLVPPPAGPGTQRFHAVTEKADLWVHI